MRRRLEQLLNGIFEYETPQLILSDERLETQVRPGSVLSGSFEVSSPNQKKVKGFLYASSPRISFSPQQFYAGSAKISFQADLSGLADGKDVEGCFTICTDLGEYTLPYLFHVRKDPGTAPATKPMEEITTAQLTWRFREDAPAAGALFVRSDFGRMLRRARPEDYLIYQSLLRREEPMQGLEEYLIAQGCKEPVELSLQESSVCLHAPQRSERYEAVLTQQGWGYLPITVSSDARFLRLEKKQLTTREFVGGTCPVGYIVDTNFLHAGKNYGRICFTTCYQTLYLEVEVIAGGVSVQENTLRTQRLMRRKLLTLYLDFRLKRIELSAWVDRSISVLAGYKRSGGRDLFADLFLVQMYFADGKKVKGKRLLEEIERYPERFRNQEQYAYYLYISTFFDQDASYVDQVEVKIEQMFLNHRDSWIMQWILLYLQERYLRDDAAKLDAIVMQIQYGCSSPIMYLEACQLLKKNPYLLRALGLVEQKLLLFAAAQKMIGEELAFRIGSLALAAPVHEPKLMRILTACYEVSPSQEVLGAICACLIAGDCKEEDDFSWYALGVDRDVRITGLYEYYMETMPTVGIEKMPQIIRMYFSYNHSLNYHRKAAIFKDISDNRDSVPQVYVSSKPGIERFVLEQLSLGRIDHNLAVLYERFLTKRVLTPLLAEKLVKLLFSFEVSCRNPRMHSVVVVHAGMKHEQEIPLIDGKARVQIYTRDARIFLADEQGRRYASPALYMAERYLDSPMLLGYCRELAPEHPGLIYYVTASAEEMTRENIGFFKGAARLEDLTEEYKDALRRKVLSWYARERRSEDLYEYLCSIDLTEWFQADRRSLMQLLTREGMYEQAFALICDYGSEEIETSCLVRICSQSVLACEYQENRQLLDYCCQCFQYGKYDDNILTYLLMYYDGPIEEMKRLWGTGQLNELDTMLLEEKILSLVIFTRSGSAGTERIFAAYQAHLGRRKLCMAYLILKSYEYLVKNLPVSDVVFWHLEQLCDREETEDVCALALLQYFSALPALDHNRTLLVQTLLDRFERRGIRFAFYQRFPEDVTAGMGLDDKVFLEYVANPAHRVRLFYRMRGQEENWQSEDMKNMFEGIFVREFVLFAEETLECYLEEYDGEERVSRSDVRMLRAGAGEDAKARYGAINRMCSAIRDKDEERFAALLDNYYQTDYLTRELFTLL